MTKIDAGMAGEDRFQLPEVRVPALLTFAGLVAGIACGALARGSEVMPALLGVTGPVGTVWLNALKMTILPLVTGLLFLGIARTVASASAGPMARKTLALFASTLAASAVLGAVAVTVLLLAFPIPGRAVRAMAEGAPAPAPETVGIADFVAGVVPENIMAAAGGGAMLPVVVFTSLFAFAATRLPAVQRDALERLFEALAGAMLIIVGWVLWLAPAGVFALAFGMASASGAAIVAALAHYIAIVAAVGLLVTVGAYVLAWLWGGSGPLRFARAMTPAQAVAISTQSSLASLPAMIASCRRLGIRDTSSEFVLPIAVALYKATSPAMNVAVIYYIARLSGMEPGLAALAAACAVAVVCSIGVAGVASAATFFVTLVPIAHAMGAPLEPLALLIAVEMLPDVVRTLGNVTMNVAVTAVIDHRADGAPDQK